VPFVLELMTAVGLTAYLAYRHGQDATNELADRLMIEVSDRVKNHLETYLDVPVQVTRDHANAIQFKLLNWQDNTTVEGYFWHRLQSQNNTQYPLNSLVLLDRQYNLTAVERIDDVGGLVYQRNRTTKGQLHRYALAPYDKRSYFIAQVDPGTPLDQKFDYPVMPPPIEGRWHLTTTPEVDPISGQAFSSLTATYLRTFYDSNYQVQGVVGASVNLAHVSRYLQELKISAKGQAFIVEQSGNLVASSTGEMLLVPSNSKPNQFNESSDAPLQFNSRLQAVRSLDTTTRQSAEFLVERFGSFNITTTRHPLSFETQGRHYFLQVTPLKHPQNLGWFLVVVIPQTDFAARLDRQYQTMIVLSAVAMLGAIVVGLATAQKIARPILRLSRASRDLMLGRLEAPVEEHSRITELAIMAHSFNEMTEQLMQSFDQVKLALQESKEKFTTVFRNSPAPILISTLPDGRVMEANDSFYRLTGYSREQAANRTTLELGFWARPDERQAWLQEIEVTGRVLSYEISALNQRGEMVTLLISSEVIELDGKPCLLTVSKDITERKQTEEALRLSEKRFRIAFDAAAIGMNIAAPNGRLLQVNPALCQMLGYSEAELLQGTYQDFTHPDDLLLDETINARILSGQVPSLTFEKRFIHKDGQTIWTLLTLALVRDLQQEPLYWVAQLQDITDRKLAEESLRQSEDRFRVVFNTATQGIAIADLQGRIIEANDWLCQKLGYSCIELQQRRLQDVVDAADLHRWEANVWDASQQLDLEPIRIRCVCKNSSVLWVQVAIFTIRDSAQSPLYLVVRIQALPISIRQNNSEVLLKSEDV